MAALGTIRKRGAILVAIIGLGLLRLSLKNLSVLAKLQATRHVSKLVKSWERKFPFRSFRPL